MMDKQAVHDRRRKWVFNAVRAARPDMSVERIRSAMSEIDPDAGDGPSLLSKDAYAVLAALTDAAFEAAAKAREVTK